MLACYKNIIAATSSNQVPQTLRCYVRVPHIMIRGVISIITSTFLFCCKNDAAFRNACVPGLAHFDRVIIVVGKRYYSPYHDT